MTKTVRIENADTGKYKVKVTEQQKVWNAVTNTMGTEWIDIKVTNLDYPTFMLVDYLTTTKRFIVEENGVTE